MTINIYTIGYEKRTIKQFINPLKSHPITKLLDIRRFPQSPYSAAYTNPSNLEGLLSLVQIKYQPLRHLAPEKFLLDQYKSKIINFSNFTNQYISQLHMFFFRTPLNSDSKESYPNYTPLFGTDYRQLLLSDMRQIFDQSVLLCYEKEHVQCHRYILAKFLQCHTKNFSAEQVNIINL